MKRIKKFVGIAALAITVAMSSMSLAEVRAEEPVAVIPAAQVDPALVSDPAVNPASDPADPTDPTDPTDPADPADPADPVDTREYASVYIVDGDENSPYGDKVDLVIDGADEESRRFKLVFTGARVDGSNPMYHNDDFTSWCNGTLPEGLSLLKYTGNTGASFARVSIEGTTTEVGNHTVTITVPSERLVVTDVTKYKLSEDGLTVTFTVNVNGISTTYVAPAAEVVIVEDHYEEPVVEDIDTDYNIFCKEVADKILSAKSGETVVIDTNIWVSFNDYVSEALDARTDVALTINFVYDNENFQTKISAGSIREMTTELIAADVDDPNAVAVVADPCLNADGHHYYGFMYLTSVYGSVE